VPPLPPPTRPPLFSQAPPVCSPACCLPAVRLPARLPARLLAFLATLAVFLISGLALDTGDVKRALKYKMGVAFGFISTLAITPCLGFAYREIPLTPDEFTVGERQEEGRE
jgi:predicted Na+-dependent transporter